MDSGCADLAKRQKRPYRTPGSYVDPLEQSLDMALAEIKILTAQLDYARQELIDSRRALTPSWPAPFTSFLVVLGEGMAVAACRCCCLLFRRDSPTRWRTV